MPAPVALFSDVHGNTPALRTVLAAIQQAGCRQVFMLGDLINGVDPHGCVATLRAWTAGTGADLACLQGNGEAYLLTPHRSALPRQDEPMTRDMLQLVDWWEARLTPADLAWIGTFQNAIRWDAALLVHDRPSDRLSPETWHEPTLPPHYQEWFYHAPGLWPQMSDTEWDTLWADLAPCGVSQVYCGHTHVPFCRADNARLVCNVGSAGASLDGDPRAAWVQVTPQTAGPPAVVVHRLDYDLAESLSLIDATPSYHGFSDARYRAAYKQWFATGVHWKAHMSGS